MGMSNDNGVYDKGSAADIQRDSWPKPFWVVCFAKRDRATCALCLKCQHAISLFTIRVLLYTS